MIKLLSKYPIRTRTILLVALAVFLSYFMYTSTVAKTLSAYSKVNAHSALSDPSSPQQQEISGLRKQLSALNGSYSEKKQNYVTNAELLLSTESEITNLNCKVYSLPKLIEDKSEVFTYGISEIVLEGRYKSLVQGLDRIEKSDLGEHLVSAKFELNKNWSSQKQELLLHLIFKQIKNEEE